MHRLAEAVHLDVAAAGWSPTVDNYFGRVTKARILQAVREAKGEQAAGLIDHLKKGEMAERAQDLLAGSGWLPEPLRTQGLAVTRTSEMADAPLESSGEESACAGYETAMAASEESTDNEPLATEPQILAAE
jgi:ParB family chromosome partitioning protein